MPGTLPGMNPETCRSCARFERPYHRVKGDMPDTPLGYCTSGATPIERAYLIHEDATCRYQPPRFQPRSKP
jgi:hypothetical protein